MSDKSKISLNKGTSDNKTIKSHNQKTMERLNLNQAFTSSGKISTTNFIVKTVQSCLPAEMVQSTGQNS